MKDTKKLFQHGTLALLVPGLFDGTLPLGSLLEHGDTGIGTATGLDGEMIILDGVPYLVRSDGSVNVLDPNTEFNREKLKDIDDLMPDVKKTIQEKVEEFLEKSDNQPYAQLKEGYMVVVKMNNEIDATDALISYLKKRIEMVH